MLGTLTLLGRPAPPRCSPSRPAPTSAPSLTPWKDWQRRNGHPGPQGWAPSHQLVRQAVTAAMHPAETARCHALLATALRQCHADPAEAASHLAASGDIDGATMAYAAAARRQLDRICDREAMRLAETGLSLAPGGGPGGLLGGTRRGPPPRRPARRGPRRLHRRAGESRRRPPPASWPQLAILDARTVDVARGTELAELAIAEAGDAPAALGQALAAGAIIDLAGRQPDPCPVSGAAVGPAA